MHRSAMHRRAWPKSAELLETRALLGSAAAREHIWPERQQPRRRLRGATLTRTAMREDKDQNRQERLERAAKAKQQILEKFRARPAADDPAVLARLAERKAIAEAREAREQERAERKRKEAEERAQREAIEKAEREARERREAVEKVIRDAADAAERKAERDRRYAARKARQAARR